MKAFEKVNPAHPDKIADRIAGALIDIAYRKQKNPKAAIEVLLGHGHCTIIAETSVEYSNDEVEVVVNRIAGKQEIHLISVPQDKHLANNQRGSFRCGDNGIFKGIPTSQRQLQLTRMAAEIYREYQTDGKYVIDELGRLIICQSCADEKRLANEYPNATINPLGHWTGGADVDTGATNRKLGSDMGDGVTGGGLHGKDLSKADVSINIACYLYAKDGDVVTASCAIGDEEVTFHIGEGMSYRRFVDSYADVVKMARGYIYSIGGFEKFAEWGLIRP
jgi:S-adenosylmethionine synthetase